MYRPPSLPGGGASGCCGFGIDLPSVQYTFSMVIVAEILDAAAGIAFAVGVGGSGERTPTRVGSARTCAERLRHAQSGATAVVVAASRRRTARRRLHWVRVLRDLAAGFGFGWGPSSASWGSVVVRTGRVWTLGRERRILGGRGEGMTPGTRRDHSERFSGGAPVLRTARHAVWFLARGAGGTSPNTSLPGRSPSTIPAYRRTS
jgi:hypothetical protein